MTCVASYLATGAGIDDYMYLGSRWARVLIVRWSQWGRG